MLIEGIEESSPPNAGRLVELLNVGLQLSLEVNAGHDDRAGVAMNLERFNQNCFSGIASSLPL